jgi:hypothetical protein
MFVRPWLQHLRSEPMARMGRVFHPQRVQQWIWSDLNPLMQPLAPMAESVKANRQPVASDNPFLAMEKTASTAMSASWDLFRDLRDAAIESLFFMTYGGLMSLGIPAQAGPETASVLPEPRETPAVRKSLESIDRGGFLEAIARVGALMASQRGEFPLSRLELAQELRESDAILSSLTDDDARRIRAEQSTLVHLEPQRALEALPKLLANSGDRKHLIDLMEKAVALVELNSEQKDMLDRIRRILGSASKMTRSRPTASSASTAAATASPLASAN